MKYCCFLAFLFSFSRLYAKEVDGYIVTMKNDTITVLIKIGSGFFGIGGHDLNRTVETVDSFDNTRTYTPDSIAAFGYTDKSEEVIYRAKPIKDGSLLFLRAIIIGAKASLYQYEESVSAGSGPTGTEEFYTFEKPDGTHLFLKNYDKLSTLRDQLRTFYGENPDIGQLIDKKFNNRWKIQRDIRVILEAVNRS